MFLKIADIVQLAAKKKKKNHLSLKVFSFFLHEHIEHISKLSLFYHGKPFLPLHSQTEEGNSLFQITRKPAFAAKNSIHWAFKRTWKLLPLPFSIRRTGAAGKTTGKNGHIAGDYG